MVTRKATFWAFVAVAIVGLGILFSMSGSRRGFGKPEVTLSDQTIAPQHTGDDMVNERLRRLELLEARLLRHDLASVSTADNVSAREPSNNARHADYETILAKEREKFSEYFSTLDRIRTEEREDHEWAGRMSTLFETAAQEMSIRGTSLAVKVSSCSSHLCRVEFSYDKEHASDAQSAIGLWITRVGKELPEASVYNDQQAGQAIAYLARSGFSLPTM